MHKTRLTGSRREAALRAVLNPKLGWRTGKDIKAGKDIRVVNGREVFDDYFTDSESDASVFDATEAEASPNKTVTRTRSAKQKDVFKAPPVSAKQGKRKSAADTSVHTKKKASGKKAQKASEDESPDDVAEKAKKPSGPPLNKHGDPLGSITRTDVVSAIPNLAEPNSALTNFRTRKRLTYSEAERLSVESAHTMLPPATRRSSRVHNVTSRKSQDHASRPSSPVKAVARASTEHASPRKESKSPVSSPVRSRTSEKPISPAQSPVRPSGGKRDTSRSSRKSSPAERSSRKDPSSPVSSTKGSSRKESTSPVSSTKRLSRKDSTSPVSSTKQSSRKKSASPVHSLKHSSRKHSTSPVSPSKQASRGDSRSASNSVIQSLRRNSISPVSQVKRASIQSSGSPVSPSARSLPSTRSALVHSESSESEEDDASPVRSSSHLLSKSRNDADQTSSIRNESTHVARSPLRSPRKSASARSSSHERSISQQQLAAKPSQSARETSLSQRSSQSSRHSSKDDSDHSMNGSSSQSEDYPSKMVHSPQPSRSRRITDSIVHSSPRASPLSKNRSIASSNRSPSGSPHRTADASPQSPHQADLSRSRTASKSPLRAGIEQTNVLTVRTSSSESSEDLLPVSSNKDKSQRESSLLSPVSFYNRRKRSLVHNTSDKETVDGVMETSNGTESKGIVRGAPAGKSTPSPKKSSAGDKTIEESGISPNSPVASMKSFGSSPSNSPKSQPSLKHSSTQPPVKVFSLSMHKPQSQTKQSKTFTASDESADEDSAGEDSSALSPKRGEIASLKTRLSGHASASPRSKTVATPNSPASKERSPASSPSSSPAGPRHSLSPQKKPHAKLPQNVRDSSPSESLDFDVNAPWSLHFDGDSPRRTVPDADPAEAKKRRSKVKDASETPKKKRKTSEDTEQKSGRKDSGHTKSQRSSRKELQETSRVRHSSAPNKQTKAIRQRQRAASGPGGSKSPAKVGSPAKKSKQSLGTGTPVKSSQKVGSPTKKSKQSVKTGTSVKSPEKGKKKPAAIRGSPLVEKKTSHSQSAKLDESDDAHDSTQESDSEWEDQFVSLSQRKKSLKQNASSTEKSPKRGSEKSRSEESDSTSEKGQKRKKSVKDTKLAAKRKSKAKTRRESKEKSKKGTTKNARKKSQKIESDDDASDSENVVRLESPSKRPVTIGTSDDELSGREGSPRKKSASKISHGKEHKRLSTKGAGNVSQMGMSSGDESPSKAVAVGASEGRNEKASLYTAHDSTGVLHPLVVEDMEGATSLTAELNQECPTSPLVSRGHLPLLSFVMMEDEEALEKAVELSQTTGDNSLLEEGLKKGRESNSPDVSTPVAHLAPRKSLVTFAASPIQSPSSDPRRSILKNRARFAATPGALSMSDSPIHYMQTTVSAPTPRPTPTRAVRIISPDSEAEGLRRSKRTRVPTLRWHENERVKYERRKSGGLVIAGVIPPLIDKYREEEEKKRQERLAKTKRRKRQRFPQRNLSTHVASVSSDEYDAADTGAVVVVDPINNQEVYVECVRTRDSMNFRGPHGNPASTEDNLILAKAIDQVPFSAGTLVIRGLQEKRTQCAGKDAVVFSISTGKVAVSIHRTTSILESGDFFFVPPENTYNIRNLRSDDAELVFFRLKG